MAGQQICLKWNSFQTNIVSSFENLWEEEGLVDVTLASDGQCIRAHKVILSACSPFFRRVFQSNPCQHPVIILQDVHFSELESLLCFVYKGEVNIGQESLPALLKAAETLQIRGLSGASEQVKEKMAVPRKSTPAECPSEASLHPPAKRHRGCSSPNPPLITNVENPTSVATPPPSTSPIALTARTDETEEAIQLPPCGSVEEGIAEEILKDAEGETSRTLPGGASDSLCGGDDEEEDYGEEDQPLAHLSLKMEPPEFDCGGDSNSLPLALTLTLPNSSEEVNIPTVLAKVRRASECRLDSTQIKGEGANNSLQRRRSRNRSLGSCGMGARRKRRHYNNFIWRGPEAATSLLGVTEGRVAIQGSEEQQGGKEAEVVVREGEEAEGQSAQGPALATPPSMLAEKSESAMNDRENTEESGPVPPYSLLPHACLLPSPSILSAWAKARTPEQLSCDLMRLLFSTEERLVCNVNGKMGKRRFDAHKVLLIREVVRYHYSECSGTTVGSGEEGTESGGEWKVTDFEERWKGCVTRIDTANRGLKRNLVLRGRKASFLV